uniref:J domain-containing protein n=1 Tax=Sinocyclocheilus anshuiensis TaxID=1608454 RepID=A0A671LRN3_9TELE
MEAILSCRKEDLEDYYGLLGCDELSTTEQIVNEFKVRALACHPDKHPENPKAGRDNNSYFCAKMQSVSFGFALREKLRHVAPIPWYFEMHHSSE